MLSQAQRAILERAKTLGGGGQGVALNDAQCVSLLATVLQDLGKLQGVSELPQAPKPFFTVEAGNSLGVEGVDLLGVFEAALVLDKDVDTYFACLAALHKSRLKYQRILATQPLATLDQVGPRALLQFGSFPPRELVALLVWRKWVFDIDNRAGQETGYLFEPIIASAIGGVSVSAARSPVRRSSDAGKGRQVDCIRDSDAYEFKLRVTIAASGQGRWQEELDFPEDCRTSGFRPVLIVLDPTPNPKLADLVKAFYAVDGVAHIGGDAWAHLESIAGPSMAVFLEKYVRAPLDSLLKEAPNELPEFGLSMSADAVVFRIGEFEHVVHRLPGAEPVGED